MIVLMGLLFSAVHGLFCNYKKNDFIIFYSLWPLTQNQSIIYKHLPKIKAIDVNFK